jgi:DNA polymerase-3 subunit delta'
MSSILGHGKVRLQLGRLISTAAVPHALLFSGQQGIGKRMIAHAFIKSLFCQGGKKPCNACSSCVQINAMTYPDLLVLSPNEKGVLPIGESDDADPNSVRGLIHRLSLRSISGRFGVIIDGIDRASNEAQNALLKTLEEPPAGSCIILISSDRSKILPTIHSRAREFRFAPLDEDSVRTIIADKASSGDVTDFIVAVAGGSASVALLLCDDDLREKILSYCRALSNTIARGVLLNQVNSPLPSLPKNGIDLLDILINVYRSLCEYKLRDESLYSSLFDDIYIDDIDALRTIIKLLFAAKRGRSNNMNLSLHIKALAYHSMCNAAAEPPFAAEHY